MDFSIRPIYFTRGLSAPLAIVAIKAAVSKGFKVFSGNQGYEVIRDKNSQFQIVFVENGYTVGLHGLPGTPFEGVLNGDINEFFMMSNDYIRLMLSESQPYIPFELPVL